MRRKVKTILALLMALALVMSCVGTEGFSVFAETTASSEESSTSAEEMTQAESRSLSGNAQPSEDEPSGEGLIDKDENEAGESAPAEETTDESSSTSEESETETSSAESETATETAESSTSENQENNNKNPEKYEQAANQALALYGVNAAFRTGEVISQDYFSIVGATYEDEFDIPTGEITAASVPVIAGYDFVNATVTDDNGGEIVVESVGMLTYDGQTYVYYTTANSSASLAAMVLGQGEQISLNYELHRETYDITYEITGDTSSTIDDIFGTDRPLTVNDGDSYAFRVSIPRGYTASVLVNGTSQGELGIEPVYTGDDSTISTDGALTLTGVYEISGVQGNQTVTVELTRRTSYQFSAELWTNTRYATDVDTPRADFGTTEQSFNASDLENENRREVWRFTTNSANPDDEDTVWILDSLQINGTDLNIPYGENSDYGQKITGETVTLPSGTEVTVELTVTRTETWVPGNWPWSQGHWEYSYSRTYVIYVSNCYEDITVTGGNLYASNSWQEIMLDRLTGVEFQLQDRQISATSPEWTTLEQSEPFGVGNQYDNGKNYWFGDTLRFRLLPGYVNPQVTYGTASGIDNNNLSRFLSNISGPDEDGWYTFRINGQGDSSFTMLRIEAEIGEYDVSYSAGNYAVDTDGTPTLPPYDDGNYNIVDNKQIIVSSIIPVDATGKNVFDYWTLEGYEDENDDPIEIHPNQLIDLETVAEYAELLNGQYVLPLEAHWIDASEADQITYTIQFVLVDEDGQETVAGEPYIYTYQAPAGSTIVLDTEADEVQEFLTAHPDYILDEEKTQRYYAEVHNGDILKVYFSKSVAEVKITKDVTGDLGDIQKDFSFTYSYADGTKNGEFTLKDGESEMISNLPVGTELTLTESGASGYTVTAVYNGETVSVSGNTEDDSKSMTITVEKGETELIVTNTKAAVPDTGVLLDSTPYTFILILAAAGILGFTACSLRRRRS